ncbi:MAG: hypothetical protein LZF62_50202 [Nitrospira sp.]|nr:MAG: hypothetical protein LZF62_50202 [Nitrospira sp.]
MFNVPLRVRLTCFLAAALPDDLSEQLAGQPNPASHLAKCLRPLTNHWFHSSPSGIFHQIT